ncbi:MAG: S-adenosyl-l-methionine hydroxide adenosyltransferase family protein [Haloferacaceae archaeon]
MITLASDFGSPYPAAMRGVLARNTDARLHDVAHDLPRQDVRGSAFWLRFVLSEFPPAVHLAVVDPGVGTDRDALVVAAGEHRLVGPDNGLLLPAARVLADDEDQIRADAARVDDPASSTFHGRDVFAPLAAAVHERGVTSLRESGRLARTDPVDLQLSEATRADDGAWHGEVLVVDDFGNAVTNVPGDALADADSARVNGTPAPVVRTFGDVAPGERLVTVGSHGYVECDVTEGRGSEAFGLSAGDAVELRL